MINLRNPFKVVFQLACLAGGFLLLIFILNGLTPSQPGASGQLPGYHFPQGQPGVNEQLPGYLVPQDLPITQTALADNLLTAYPVPRTATPRNPRDATDIARYLLQTPSSSEIAAGATFMAEKLKVAQNYTPQPAITPFTFPIKSVADLPQVVYHDPFYGDVNSRDFGACIKAASPSSPLLVHSLEDQRPDYYILPFYKDATICGLAMVSIKDNLGLVGGWAIYYYGDKYPPVSSEEAVNLVIQKTHQNVISTPLLVFRPFQEDGSPFVPLWRVVTGDGEIYYVWGIRAMMETDIVTTAITVMNAKEMHPLN